MEQIRIIKELRQCDEWRNRRTGKDIRPRFMVWENVPGAFSSNKGEDFHIVLEETAKVAERHARIPKFDGTWPKSGCIMGTGWSVAWRVHDAQFWGVPQRRKRIALVADFGGASAPEVLFEREGVPGNLEPCGAERQRTSEDAERSIRETSEPILLESNQNNATIQTNGISTALPASMGMGGGYIPMILSGVGVDVYNQEVTGEVAASLTAASGGTGTSGPKVLCLNDQGGSVMDVSEEVTGTLRAQEHGHQPCVMSINTKRQSLTVSEEKTGTLAANDYKEPQAVLCGGFKPNQGAKAHGVGYEDEKAPILLSEQTPAVVYGISAYESNAMKSSNPHSGIYEADTARTLDNNGGNPACNQGGMVVVCIEGNGSRPSHKGDGYSESETMYTLNGTEHHAVCIGNGQANQIEMSDKVGALNCMHDQQAVMTYQNVTGTLDSCISKGTDNQIATNNMLIANTSIVRRLTPLECERLQGFPDHWTDIGEWTDSKGKKHKDADGPRYKALGNSIALPFWEWLAKRICAQYEHKSTMASLFSGIGGFELVFSRAGCEPVWASEVDEFCIAVSKSRFPDNERGWCDLCQ